MPISNKEGIALLRSIIGKTLTHLNENSERAEFEFLYLLGEIKTRSAGLHAGAKLSVEDLKILLSSEFDPVGFYELDLLASVLGFPTWQDFIERVPTPNSPEYLASRSLQLFELWKKFWENPAKDEPVGIILAGQVAAQLMNGRSLVYRHRDYCGTGLIYYDKTFFYSRFYDGSKEKLLEKFTVASEFITWLAHQTDRSLSGEREEFFYKFNQRITRLRLIEFVGQENLIRKHAD